MGDLEPAILAIVLKLSTAPGDATAANQAIILADIATAIADIATSKTVIDETNGYLEVGGDIHDVLYADAAGASIAVDIAAIPTVMVGTDNAALAADWTAALATILGNFSAARIGYLDELAAANLPADIDTINTKIAEVHDVIIYPVAEHAATTEIADDGTSPALYADTEPGTATSENNPNVHWSEDIDFEQSGTINVISIFAELRWQHKTSGGTAYSKVQMSRDGGENWVDMTDSIAETNVAYHAKTRIGVGRVVTTIVAGANQLEFRLVSWEAGGATSGAKMRSDSYMRLTYRKS